MSADRDCVVEVAQLQALRDEAKQLQGGLLVCLCGVLRHLLGHADGNALHNCPINLSSLMHEDTRILSFGSNSELSSVLVQPTTSIRASMMRSAVMMTPKMVM